MIRRVVLLLGDQLTPAISSLKEADKTRDIVLMCELSEEATYVRHHKKKIAFIFSAMRHFTEELRSDGWRVDYRALGDTSGSRSFTRKVELAVSRHSPEGIVVTAPGEWRVLDAMRGWQQRLGVPVEIVEDNRFLCSKADFAAWAQGRKQVRHGADACPFNALYWAFLARDRDKLGSNPRMAQMYRTWDKLSDDRRRLTIASAEAFLSELDESATPGKRSVPPIDDAAISEMILRMCSARGAGKSICPSKVARALDADVTAWRALMPDVRRVAGDLASRGLIAVTQRDRSVDAASSRGATRLALPAEPKRRSRKK